MAHETQHYAFADTKVYEPFGSHRTMSIQLRKGDRIRIEVGGGFPSETHIVDDVIPGDGASVIIRIRPAMDDGAFHYNDESPTQPEG